MWKLKVGDEGRCSSLMTVNNHVGRQQWEFDPDAGTPEDRAAVDGFRLRFRSNRFVNKQSSDLLMRMQMRKEKETRRAIPAAVKVDGVEEVTEEAVKTTMRRGLDYLCSIQAQDGHWPSDCAGPLYFMPPLVMVLYITGGLNSALSSQHQKEMKRYIYNHQNEDGGWGLHIEGNSSMLCSILNYVALRLLGEDDLNDDVSRGRNWILDHGGAVAIPSWGKLYLSVLGVYEWDGCNPLSPEFWLLPTSSPLNPGQMMCYVRLVYLPMSYLYGKRFVGKITPLVERLRQELYIQPYHHINWNLARTTCAQEDQYFQRPFVQDIMWGFLYHVGESILKFWPFSKLRENALKVVMNHIHYEDINSRYVNIGSLEKILRMIACWVEDPNSEAYKLHLARVEDYIWVAEDGMKLQGLGSQMWEAAFGIQAIMSTNLTQECGETLHKAHTFLKASQISENPSGDFAKMYRHRSKGGWAFSTQDNGWQVSDCTGEGLKVVSLCSQMPKELVGEKIETIRLYDAVDIILTFQSENGGFSAWEPPRVNRWFEKFNPTDIFKDVLIETEYVECTSSAVQGLTLFKKTHPTYRTQDVENCIRKSLEYILGEQNPDGSWIGNWGICFTYGTWFAVEALISCGLKYDNSRALRKACEFLLMKQLPDGGWGESYLACLSKEYTNIEGNKSNLVQTSWALLALIKAGQIGIDPVPVKEGVKLLINSQVEQDGDFPQQLIMKVFLYRILNNYL